MLSVVLIKHVESVALRGEISFDSLNGADRGALGCVVVRARRARAKGSSDTRNHALSRSHLTHHDG